MLMLKDSVVRDILQFLDSCECEWLEVMSPSVDTCIDMYSVYHRLDEGSLISYLHSLQCMEETSLR